MPAPATKSRTERGQVGPCPTDEDHRPLSERVRVLAATLVPGQYTASLAGVNNGTGVGLVEVYDRGAP